MTLTPYQFWVEANTLSRAIEGLIIAVGVVMAGVIVPWGLSRWHP